MLIKNKSVAIIGGGPGGLTLARLLQMKGVQVKVYERDFDKNARVQGSLLDMHQNSGLAAIRAAGLLEAFKENFMIGADKTQIMDEQAKVWFSDHDSKPDEEFGEEYFRPEIDRGTLRKILLNSLNENTVVWNSHFLSMEKENKGWILNFKNKPSVYADIVIGCDGANSKIRPYITEIKPFYTGIVMLEGNIPDADMNAPEINKILKGGKIMAFGNQKNLLIGLKGKGAIGFYASFKADEKWNATNGLNYSDKAEIIQWYKKTYPEWSNIWLELFESAEVPFIPRPVYCMPFDQCWKSSDSVTIIGDAAHVMPPFAGEGANMAMKDALDLSECLISENYSTMQEAFAGYESEMRKRASSAAKESVKNGEIMHSEMALQPMLDFFGSFK
ncbi:FAD-dependent oxidoreductase [Chryseobacterium profundimaris]|uniref:Flavin-dependent monooxygenase n=1 Tax=Chryseobacterium profundimaris TaxID=1387275 RepID=A0ABY1NZE9_9FLAO|nr:NAD(P)/FAD-dependent oxidoreductase [Chryseobacterium profundimaris]SMP21509.1 2-polyprenyl-6-methoxyphenol hydroxylase [Chryseobacterium profundimaris]